MTTRAHSIDGRHFAFDASLRDVVPIGSYVQIEADEGRAYLGQVMGESVVDAEGSPATTGPKTVKGRGVLLARLTDVGSTRVEPTDVFGDGIVTEAAPDVVAAHLATATARGAGLRLGSLGAISDVPATLAATGFGRHTFLCGQSGSGKTYTLGLILEQLLLETDIRIAVLDPNSDYVNMAELRPRDDTDLSEGAYDDLTAHFAPIASRIHVFGGDDAPRQLKTRFGRLSRRQQTMVLGLDPIANAGEYSAFLRVVGRIDGEDYTLEDVLDRVRASFGEDERHLGMRIVNLGIADLSIWAHESEPAIREQLPTDWRMVVFDLGSLPSDRERSIASAAVLGTFWEERHERTPLLIVVDEAHNVCPQLPSDVNQALATDHAIKIAGEGRKFGKYLLLSTQRPEKVHHNVVSQCDNLVLMRMNSSVDIEQLKRIFSFAPPTLIEQAHGFGLGEGLAAGKIAPDPFHFRTGRRLTLEGGSDVPAGWARPQ